MSKHILSLLALILISGFVLAQTTNLVQWRGDNRDGKYKETGLLKKWPKDGPEILWTANGFGTGYSSVIVAGDMIFTTGADEDQGYVYGLDKSGKQRWKTFFGTEWTTSFEGTRTTPTFLNGKLYVHSSYGMAVCLDAGTGKILWQDDLNKKYKVRVPRWGISEAPLIIDDKVIFTPGGEEIIMIAKNINSGETIWESKLNGDIQAYNSPAIVTHNGNKMIITNLSRSVVGVNPETGELLWQYSQVNKYDVHPNTPIYENGFVYSFTGYGVGGIMLKISDDGKSVSKVWENSSQDNQMGGGIWLDGKIYASGQKNRDWQCLDAKTGKLIQSIDDISKGTIIHADGMFYCYGDKGEIGLMKPTANGFEFVSKCSVDEGTNQHWAHLVIKDGVLYVRHGDSVIAYNIKSK
jgi:outer membrane protein assembly factor BamB